MYGHRFICKRLSFLQQLKVLLISVYQIWIRFARAPAYFGKQIKLSTRPIHIPKTVRLTNGPTRLERKTRPRRTAGPGPARVLVHPSETWSHPRGTLGRCHKGSEINIQCFKYCIVAEKNSPHRASTLWREWRRKEERLLIFCRPYRPFLPPAGRSFPLWPALPGRAGRRTCRSGG